MSKTIKKQLHKKLYEDIKALLHEARTAVARNINTAMVMTYFEIGRMIVEHEQEGANRAAYAKETLKSLSQKLTAEFGRGFSSDNLELMRRFYLVYSKSETLSRQSELLKLPTESTKSPAARKSETLSRISPIIFQLSWSHYVFLMRLPEAERKFYEIEAVNQNWSLRELERQFNSSLYERLALSRDKHRVKELSQKGHILTRPQDAIKEPYVLEFLGLKEESAYSESDLESAIINRIEHFMLELGKGFLFSGRQVRLTFNEDHFFVDLVFYNRLLKCFVLIDLKIGKLKHQDLGQMQMYVNYYDRYVRAEDENKTIGIILCKDKNKALVEITLPKENEQIFARKYQLYLPSKEELKRQLEE
jgi:predicted nuclease of restriction endonuclease-like (RecB) superfamily